MNFDIDLKNDVELTETVRTVMSDFDIKPEHSCEHFKGSIDIDDKDWNVGLIVGSSGTGKSTIARELFKDNYVNGFEYDDKSVIDNMPGDSINDIELAFTSVGFSSPPCWLKKYRNLSTGEKMRADLARALLSKNELICFDEFTSVVDRTVAKTCSEAIQKNIRKNGKKFVAVTCHRDVAEYLQPDWVYDTDTKAFFIKRVNTSTQRKKLMYTKLAELISKQYGEYLGSITI